MMEALQQLQTPSAVWYTDASGSWGCGAYWEETGRWSQGEWHGEWLSKNISTKEMLPIVLATAMWGRHCCHKHVLIYCDNMAVVDIMATKKSKEPGIMHLLRCLHFFTAIFDVNLRVVHLAGKLNTTADAISRNSMQILQGTCNIQQHPDPIPSSLWQLLVTM